MSENSLLVQHQTCFSLELPKALHKSCSQSIVLRPSIHPSNERRVKPAQSGLCA